MANTTISEEIKWKLSKSASRRAHVAMKTTHTTISLTAAKVLPSVQIELSSLTSSTIPTAKSGRIHQFQQKNSKKFTRDMFISTNCCSPMKKNEVQFVDFFSTNWTMVVLLRPVCRKTDRELVEISFQ